MHPELIKALIRMSETTPAALAGELSVSRMAVSSVIHGRGKSSRIAERISQAVKRPISELWPGKYDTHAEKAKPKKSAPRRRASR